jgi:hypothetical protein
MLMLLKLGRSCSRATVLNYGMNMTVVPTALSEGGQPGGRPGRVVKVGISIPQNLASAVDAELALSPGTTKSAFFADAVRRLLTARSDARLAGQAALLDDGDVEDAAFEALR